jgi:type IV secretion system protein VirB10
MSKFSNFISALKKNIAGRKENGKQEENAQKPGATTVTEAAIEDKGVDNKELAFRGRTINKKRIFSAAGLCIAAFLGSFLFFTQEGARTPRPQQIEVSDGLINTGSNNYATLARAEKSQTAQPGRNGQSGNQETNQPAQTSSARQTALSLAAPPTNLSIAREQISAAEAEAKKLAKIQADAFAAAISFSLPKTATNNVSATARNSNTATPAVTTSPRQSPAENSLSAGTLLPAMLMNGASSDLDGQLMAQITADIFDSLQGNVLLIPMGSRLIGQYEAGAALGQSRVAVNWTQLTLPDGSSYNLDDLTSSDEAGYPGIPGKVNNHSDKALTGGVMSTALAALGTAAAGNTGSSDNVSAGSLAMQGATANLLNSASSLFNKNLNIKPTITVEPGTTFTVRVNQTLVLQPYHSRG